MGGASCEPTTEICDGLDNDCDDTPDQGATCPANCVADNTGDHIWVFCSQLLTQPAARAVCMSIGLDLVTIESSSDNLYVEQSGITLPVWLGATDSGAEGIWLWPNGDQFWEGTDTGTAIGGRYSDWAAGEPNASAGANCATLTSGGWRDGSCTVTNRFVCRDL